MKLTDAKELIKKRLPELKLSVSEHQEIEKAWEVIEATLTLFPQKIKNIEVVDEKKP